MSDDELELEAAAREALYAELAQHGAGGITNAPEGSLLTGWLVVTEWEAPDGGRWLSTLSGDAAMRSLTPWREKGYAASIVHGSLDHEYDDDDDDKGETSD